LDEAAEDEASIIRFVNQVLKDAIELRASDIHLEPFEDEFRIRYRIDGELQEVPVPAQLKRFQPAIVSRVKILSHLNIAEKRLPQDGRIKIRLDDADVDIRVSVIPMLHGEAVVMRLLRQNSTLRGMGELDMDKRELDCFQRVLQLPHGIILVTGPTGSGKTTTLYAAVNEIKTDEDKIITIEDPVEYQLRGITQIPVNEKKGLTFARGLRSILRHDPDKIMVGEIRDNETAQIAIQSALTGHLVFTTVHANNVVDVLGRFLNMGVEPYNFVSALNCILAQRLVRVICDSCRTAVHYPNDVLEASGLDAQQWSQVPLYEGQGCIECAGTGFRGRTAIHELLDLTDRIREMILERRPTSEIRKAAREDGMRFLRESALDKVRGGFTTLKEINKVTFIETMR
jgi:type IV pilus assembly protein PilB